MATTPLKLVTTGAPSTAAQIKAGLTAAESEIDAGVIHAAEMISKTIRAAAEAGVHRTSIQRMLLRLHSAQEHGLKAQWDLQIYHQQCREHLKKLNVEELGWGDQNSPAMDPESGDAETVMHG